VDELKLFAIMDGVEKRGIALTKEMRCCWKCALVCALGYVSEGGEASVHSQ